MLRQLILFFSIFLIISACDKAPEQTKESPKKNKSTSEQTSAPVQQISTEPFDLMNRPGQLIKFETIAEAITIWRQFSDQKPTLLLLTGSPALTPPPAELQEKIDALAINGSVEEIRSASATSNPELLFRPAMSLDIALRSQFFNQLNWVLPMQDQSLAPDQEAIRTQFIDRRMLTEQEANSLVLEGQVITGVVRNIPFIASNISQTTQQDRPVIVHIDLGYFQSLYKNEIATPIIQSIYQTLATLKQKHFNTLAVTFSYNHLDSGIALDVRFVGEILSTLISQPELLDKPVPPNWKRQADAIYLANFFQKEKIEELFKAQQQEDPESAWVNFNLYRSSAERKEGNMALEYLAKAVAIDQIYALEYANLSRLAYDKKRPDEALRMLSLASKAFPEDPFVKLTMAQLAQELGETETAKHLIEQLQDFTWSEVYYPNMTERLRRLSEKKKEDREEQ